MFAFDTAEKRLRNMSAMLDRLGLDHMMLARGQLGRNLASALRTCQACSAEEMCRDWLARAPNTLERAPRFCPNAERFAVVRAVEFKRTAKENWS
jgi:hypothetical protein